MGPVVTDPIMRGQISCACRVETERRKQLHLEAALPKVSTVDFCRALRGADIG